MLDTRNNDTMYACVPHYDQSRSGGVPFFGGCTSFQVKMATLSILAGLLNWCLVTCVIWQLCIQSVGWSNFLGIVKQCIFRQILDHFGFVEFETQRRKEHIGRRLVWRCRPRIDSTGYFCWQHPESIKIFELKHWRISLQPNLLKLRGTIIFQIVVSLVTRYTCELG